MKIAKCDIVPYVRPFRRPIRFAYGTFSERSGYYIDITTTEGITGSGEIAPLPLYRPVDTNAVESVLSKFQKKIIGWEIPHAASEIETVIRDIVPLNFEETFGIASALLDAAARTERKPLAGLLNKNYRPDVDVNCLITPPIENMEALAEAIQAKRYQAAKIKVGARTIQEDAEFTKEVAAALGSTISLRLDANRAWSLRQAIDFFRRIDGVAIDYIEEPVSGGHDELQAFRASTGVSVALDESLISYRDIMDAAGDDNCDIIIIKPSLLYGPATTILACETLVSNGKRVVVSSLLETETGMASLIHLASALPDVTEPAGLDTLSYFAEYSSRLSLVTDGAIRVPEGLGNGYERSHSGPR
ncbi:MAG: o-succinylbenzoate synthase [Candidatus Zixiibacteriota bacterium]